MCEVEEEKGGVAMSQKESSSTPVPPSKSFEGLISMQDSSGFWPESAFQSLAQFFEDGVAEDEDVREAITSSNV